MTVKTQKCGGRPCIRGMRIRVSDALDLGVSMEEVLEDFSDLENEDIYAALLWLS